MVYSGSNLDYSKKITIFYKFIFIYYNIMNMKTKTIFALVLTGAFSILWVSANEVAPTTTATATPTTTAAPASTFSLNEVKVVDQDTIAVSFNKDLLEDVSFFEFLLTPTSDDTKEIALSNLTLSGTNALEVTTAEALQPNQDYNLVVVFASDKEGNVIENGVDGMVTFTTPETFAEQASVEWALNAAPMEQTPAAETPATTTDVAPAQDAAPVVATETAAATADALPQTGPTEILFVVLALLLGLGFTYVRRNA